MYDLSRGGPSPYMVIIIIIIIIIKQLYLLYPVNSKLHVSFPESEMCYYYIHVFSVRSHLYIFCLELCIVFENFIFLAKILIVVFRMLIFLFRIF